MSNTSSGSFTPYQYSGNSNGTFRKAGDYLKDFTKQSGSNLSNVLGYKDDDNEDASTATNRRSTDLRGGVRNSSSSSSNVSKVLSGDNSNTSFKKPAKTPTQTPTQTPASAANTELPVTSSAYDPWVNGIPSVKERVEMYENSLTGDSKANFRKQKVATDKYGNKSPQESSYDFYTGLYQQQADDRKWIDTYSGPKTFEEAAQIPTGPARGAADRTAATYNSVLKYQKAERERKQTQDYYAKIKAEMEN